MFQIVLGVVILLAILNNYYCQDIWHSQANVVDFKNRDEIVIQGLTADTHFKNNFTAERWKNVNLEDKTHLAGVTNKTITTLVVTLNSEENQIFNIESHNIEIVDNVVDFVLFKNWSALNQDFNAVLGVATDKPEIIWFKLEPLKEPEQIWAWPLLKKVTHVNVRYNELEESFCLIAGNQQDTNGNSIDIYKFVLGNKFSYWLLQSITLDDTPKSSAVISYKSEIYLLVPQPTLNVLQIFKYSQHHFELYSSLTSEEIDQVISFEIGHKVFIAINGLAGGIYEVKNHKFEPAEIINSHSHNVKHWREIYINNYRGDVILLAERNLDFETHQSSVIEALVYNHEKFEEHEDVNCDFFGEHYNGLNCLDEYKTQNSVGDIGYIALKNHIALLVPQENKPSILFTMNFEVKQIEDPIRNEMRILENTKTELQKLIDEVTERFQNFHNPEVIVQEPTMQVDFPDSRAAFINPARHEALVAQSTPLMDEIAQIKSNLEELRQKMNLVEQFEQDGNFENIFINGDIEIEGDTNVISSAILTQNDQKFNDILQDIVRNGGDKQIQGQKTFTNLKVQNMEFQKINKVDASNLIFLDQDVLAFQGLHLHQPIIVKNNIQAERVNDLVFERNVVADGQFFDGNLSFDNVGLGKNLETTMINKVPISINIANQKSELGTELNELEFDTVFIPRNITISNINGESFGQILSELCLTNIRNYIPGTTTIRGNITTQTADVEELNSLKFPDDYLMVQGNVKRQISGTKTFTKGLRGQEIRTSGLINNETSSNYLTLSTPQAIPSQMTFDDLRITEKLKVHGQIVGQHFEKFVPNPTLLDTNVIRSKVSFINLEVEGNIILEETLNEANFEEILSDIVYQDEDTVFITSKKDFPEGLTVRKNLQVKSEAINETSISSFVTKNTAQELSFDILKGDISFDNLDIKGLYNNIDITKLDSEVAKINGQQFISSTLVFKEDVTAKQVVIEDELNDIPISAYLITNGDQEFDSDFKFEDITAEKITIGNDFNGTIPELSDFEARRLSFTKDQHVTGLFEIKNVHVNDLRSEIINQEVDNFNVHEYTNQLMKKLESGEILVKKLIVNGTMVLDKVNNQHMESLFRQSLEDQMTESALTINGDVLFKSLEINELSDVNFNYFVSNVAMQNDPNLVVKGIKTFTNGFNVLNFVETNKLNGIYLENILRKQGVQNISGPLEIIGDASFGAMLISENLNNVLFDTINDNFKINDMGFVIKNDVLFDRLAHVDNLNIKGFVDDHLMSEFLTHVVSKDENITFINNIVFKDDVVVDGDMEIKETLNTVSVSEFAQNVVSKVDADDLDGVVVFEKPTYIHKTLNVGANMQTQNLLGYDLENWKQSAAFVDQGRMLGNYHFENVEIHDGLFSNHLNNVCLNTTIPLATNQDIQALNLGKAFLYNDVQVANLVNGYKLSKEIPKTLMANEVQEIFSNVQFSNNVLIRQNLTVHGHINNYDPSTVVTTNENQVLTANYEFTSKTTMENMNVKGAVNSIDIVKWAEETVPLASKKENIIDDEWIIENSTDLMQEISGDARINEYNMTHLVDLVTQKRNLKHQMENSSIEDYKNICKDLDFMYEVTQNQIYKFKQFDYHQFIDLPTEINYIRNFQVKGNNYLLVNEKNSCQVHLFVLVKKLFQKLREFELGTIEQLVVVPDQEHVYFVVRNNGNCSLDGTNVWKFSGEKLTHMATLENQQLLQESLAPGTFYGGTQFEINEFKINYLAETPVRKYRKWNIETDKYFFVPRGLGTGLAIRTPTKIIKLFRDDPIIDVDDTSEVETVLVGKTNAEETIVPFGSDVVVFEVGRNVRKTLLGVTLNEKSTVKGKHQVIKIYENSLTGQLYQSIPTTQPSKMAVLEFNSGETLLAFIENNEMLQIFEYKGVEGLKNRMSVPMEGTALFTMDLDLHQNGISTKMLGVQNKNRISLIKAVMTGKKNINNLRCNMSYL